MKNFILSLFCAFILIGCETEPDAIYPKAEICEEKIALRMTAPESIERTLVDHKTYTVQCIRDGFGNDMRLIEERFEFFETKGFQCINDKCAEFKWCVDEEGYLYITPDHSGRTEKFSYNVGEQGNIIWENDPNETIYSRSFYHF